VSTESLEDKLGRVGGPVEMLRHAPAGAYEIPGRGEFANWRDEQRAWKATAVVFDQSNHMTDVYFRGPDARRLLSDTGVNSFRAFGRNRAKQFVACNHDGYVIGDAVLFGFEEDEMSLVGRPAVPNWVAYQAEKGNYDVTVFRDERSVANNGTRRTFRYLWGARTRSVSSGLLFPGSAGCWRNSAYAVSSDRQSA
jgi:glycine cleavage system aminomethyltransferase T